jgi:hypothetical protein
MPQGRDISKKKSVRPAVDQNIQNNFTEPLVSEFKPQNKSKIKSKSLSNFSSSIHDDSCDMPRTPPIAADFLIETIACGDIEDTFLNDEEASNENKALLYNNKSIKKFSNLPTFLINTETPPEQQRENLLNKILNADLDISNRTPESEIEKTPTYSINNDETSSSLYCKNKTITKQLNIRKKESQNAKKKYVVTENALHGIKLNSLIGYNGKHSTQNMIWNVEREFFAYTLGSIVCVENLKTGKQTLLDSHFQDITCLCLRNTDSQHMASGSPSLNSDRPQSQIIIWECENYERVANLIHKNAENITFLKYSTDDRFLVSIGDHRTFNLWKTFDYSLLTMIENSNYTNIYDLAWNPLKCNEFIFCGKNKLLVQCYIDEKPLNQSSIRFNELDVPYAIREQQNDRFDFTSISYSTEDYLLYAATNHGLLTVWNVKTSTCFLNWRADSNEIDCLISMKHKLITGSSKGSLKLWNVSSIHKMKQGETKSR